MSTPAGASVLVCFALKEEASPFLKRFGQRNDVGVVISGMGASNARLALRAQLQSGPLKLVFTCGFAGALSPRLKLGEVIFQTTDPALQQRLMATGAHAATFHCAPRVATAATEKRQLLQCTGADAVEMESGVIQEICRETGLPCATVRAISDAADTDLPFDFNQLSQPDQSLNHGKLLWALARSPGKLPALLRLQRNCAFAAARLADVLCQVV